MQAIRPFGVRPRVDGHLDYTNIDNSLEAVASPLLDPALINMIVNGSGTHSYHMVGEVNTPDQKLPFDLNVRIHSLTDSPTRIDGRLSGTFAGLPMDVGLDSSGLTFTENGHLGNNDIKLTSHYSILSGNVTSWGSVGKVWFNLTSFKDQDESIVINGKAYDQTMNMQISHDLNVTGAMGKYNIWGGVQRVDNRNQVATTQIGPVQISEKITEV